jgi:hypothetical protein
MKTINALEAKRLATEAIREILVAEAEVLDESLELSDAVLTKIFEKIEVEAKSGSSFCYYNRTEEEYYHSCNTYIIAYLSEFGYSAKIDGGSISVFW